MHCPNWIEKKGKERTYETIYKAQHGRDDLCNHWDGVTWANTTLRKFLNNEFYNRFNREEKAKILVTRNSYYTQDLTGNTSTASDYVFILDVQEAEKYFQNDTDRISIFNVLEKDLIAESQRRYEENRRWSDNTYEDYYNALKNDNGKVASWDLRSFYSWGELPHMSCVGNNGYVFIDAAEDLDYQGDAGTFGGEPY